MKKYEFNISKNILNKFFPKQRVKNKVQIIEILMEAVRYILINPSITNNESVGKIILYVDSRSEALEKHLH